MWRPGKAVVPHRHEEPASYRPTTTARKHGPLQSRTGRRIRDVDRGYALLWSRLRRHCLILIDARFSSCSPRSRLRGQGLERAAGDEQETVAIDKAQIPCPEPSVRRERRAIGLGIVDIACRDRAPVQFDLADPFLVGFG